MITNRRSLNNPAVCKIVQRKRTVEEFHAYNLYHIAVRKGLIVPADVCSHCGFEGTYSKDILAHHSDYSRPFDVIYLCRSCHAKIHKVGHILIYPRNPNYKLSEATKKKMRKSQKLRWIERRKLNESRIITN
jgi:hypothetical protein